jgi:hypothetical protein
LSEEVERRVLEVCVISVKRDLEIDLIWSKRDRHTFTIQRDGSAMWMWIHSRPSSSLKRERTSPTSCVSAKIDLEYNRSPTTTSDGLIRSKRDLEIDLISSKRDLPREGESVVNVTAVNALIYGVCLLLHTPTEGEHDIHRRLHHHTQPFLHGLFRHLLCMCAHTYVYTYTHTYIRICITYPVM